MSFKLQWKDQGVYVKHSGLLALSDIREQDDIMYGDDRYNYIKYQIIDFLNVTKTTIRNEDIYKIAGPELGAIEWKKHMKIAWVVNDLDIIKLIDQYIQLLNDSGWTFKKFETIQEAEKWCSA